RENEHVVVEGSAHAVVFGQGGDQHASAARDGWPEVIQTPALVRERTLLGCRRCDLTGAASQVRVMDGRRLRHGRTGRVPTGWQRVEPRGLRRRARGGYEEQECHSQDGVTRHGAHNTLPPCQSTEKR